MNKKELQSILYADEDSLDGLRYKNRKELIEVINACREQLYEQVEMLNKDYLILYELASEVWPNTNRPLAIALSEREDLQLNRATMENNQ